MPDELAAAESLDVRQLTVRYGTATVLQAVDVTVSAGEVVALLGPSGAGKSTLIHAVAGFQQPTAGEIWLGGLLVASASVMVPPERRRLAVVFQNYALWPHLSALDTVAYPARRRGTKRAAARREALEILDRLDIAHLAARLPSELSGGEQQRVGLARALARKASLYLFDEPTAHLDTQVRSVFLEELTSRLRSGRAGAVYATHDAEEALGLADRVVLVDAGRVVQTGAPTGVYDEPVDLRAARLTGQASVLCAVLLSSEGDTCTVALAGSAVSVECPPPASAVGESRRLLVRPGWARLGGELAGRLREVWFRGPHSDYLMETEAGTVLIREPGPPRCRAGESCGWSLQRTWVLDEDQPTGPAPADQPSTRAGPDCP